ncbi:hypothetical protein I4U23_011341 [Adineta vaga]|nr:hypothetical protein I4U23_011341 [Adineta vaga]
MMKRSTRSQKTNVHKNVEIAKVDTDSLSEESSITHLEELSNEVIYEIFEFLDYFHVYQSFFNLNTRFQNLLTCSNLPIKVNTSSISRSNFENYYTDIIIPYQHRIISLSIRHLFFDCDISVHTILSKFIRLETLILEHISPEYIENVLNDIASLSNLSSLVIIVDGDVENENECLLQIFRLPTLKYCQISLRELCKYGSLPFATNENSPIEQLVIKHFIYSHNIENLLSYVPQLRRLSLDYSKDQYIKTQHNHSITLNYLTHLFLKLNEVSFDEFEHLIKNFFCKTQVLHLDVKIDGTFYDDNRWEQLILSHMPLLRVFDIRIDNRYHRIYDSQLKLFNSPFWLQRQWFFDQQDYYGTIFYSTNPYRRKEYTIEQKINPQTDLDYQITNLNSVRHACIVDEIALNNCIYRFPNATDLTLKCISLEKLNEVMTTLQHIIPWNNLTKLEITNDKTSLEILIQVLPLIRNLITVKLDHVVVDTKDFVAIRKRANFQLAANANIIRNLTVQQINEVEEAKLLTILCPRLQHFTITKISTLYG